MHQHQQYPNTQPEHNYFQKIYELMVRDKEHGNIGRQYNGNCAKSKLNYSYLVNAGTLKVEKKIYWVNDK